MYFLRFHQDLKPETALFNGVCLAEPVGIDQKRVHSQRTAFVAGLRPRRMLPYQQTDSSSQPEGHCSGVRIFVF